MVALDQSAGVSGSKPGPERGFDTSARRLFARLIIVAILFPFSFELAGFRLTPVLITMILLFPILATQFLTRVVIWRLPDLFFFLFVTWQGLTIFLNSPERFVAYTGTQTLLTLTAYLAGRLLIRTKEDFMSLVLFWVCAVLFSIPFALYEGLVDVPLIIRFFADYTPFNTFNENDYDPRLGLYRAQFVFVHPIHYGLLSALILMPFFIGLKNHLPTAIRFGGAMLIGMACFLSVSSGAVLSIMLQLVVFAWYQGSTWIGPNPWRRLLIWGGMIFTILELASTKSVFVAFSTRLSFNSNTTYYRTLIWEYGSQQVWRTPIFGNGERYWARPAFMRSASVDNYWLLTAMVHGLPALIFFASALLYAFFMVSRTPGGQDDPQMTPLRVAWVLALLGFCMSASTVAIWGEIQVLFMLFFGAGFWMIGYASHPNGTLPEPTPQKTRETQYSRFPPRTQTPTITRDPAVVAQAKAAIPQFARKHP